MPLILPVTLRKTSTFREKLLILWTPGGPATPSRLSRLAEQAPFPEPAVQIQLRQRTWTSPGYKKTAFPLILYRTPSFSSSDEPTASLLEEISKELLDLQAVWNQNFSPVPFLSPHLSKSSYLSPQSLLSHQNWGLRVLRELRCATSLRWVPHQAGLSLPAHHAARLLFLLNPTLTASPPFLAVSPRVRMRLLQHSPGNLQGSHKTILGLLLSLKEGRLARAEWEAGVEEIQVCLWASRDFSLCSVGNYIPSFRCFPSTAAKDWHIIWKVRLAQQKNTWSFINRSFLAVNKNQQAWLLAAALSQLTSRVLQPAECSRLTGRCCFPSFVQTDFLGGSALLCCTWRLPKGVWETHFLSVFFLLSISYRKGMAVKWSFAVHGGFRNYAGGNIPVYIFFPPNVWVIGLYIFKKS